MRCWLFDIVGIWLHISVAQLLMERSNCLWGSC